MNQLTVMGSVTVIVVSLAIATPYPDASAAIATPASHWAIAQNAIGELPESVSEAVLDIVVRQTGLPQSNFEITQAEQKTWPDGCLGLADPEVFCTQALVSGWQVTVTNSEETWVYRTDSNGSLVMLDAEASSAYDLVDS